MVRSTLLLLLCLKAIDGYSSGAPPTVCGSMAPNVEAHGAGPQNSSSPYNVTIDVPNGGAMTGNSYTVSINASKTNARFEGFLCQVRKTNESTALGSFTSFDTGKAKNLNCNSSTDAVTHKNNDAIGHFSATWKAPDSVSGNNQLTAYCTVVEHKDTYWVKVPTSIFTLTMSSTAATSQPQPHSAVSVGIQCYDCSQPNKDDCLVNGRNIDDGRVQIVTCSADEVCSVRVHAVFGLVQSAQRGCRHKSTCQPSSTCQDPFSAGYCLQCCDCDLCNTGDELTPVSCPTCYSCSQPSRARCEVTEDNIKAGYVTQKTCTSGQVCGTRVDGTTVRDCYDTAQCSISKGYVACCNGTLCNNEETVPTHRWELTAGPCSHSCGRHGSHIIAPHCVRQVDNATVSDNVCTDQQKPSSQIEPCNRYSCPARWITERFEMCSSTCEGVQVRNVYCEQLQGDGEIRTVPDLACIRDDRRIKPISTRSCGTKCPKYTWITEEWANCSAVCGQATETRRVYCQNTTRTPMNNDDTVDDSYCLEAKPKSTRDCSQECRISASSWSTCSVNTGCGHQTRSLACVQILSNNSQIEVSLKHCQIDAIRRNQTLPAEQRPCQCSYRYALIAWSPCSVTCDTGFQYGQMKCIRVYSPGNTNIVVDDSHCSHLSSNSSRSLHRRLCSRICVPPQIMLPPRQQPLQPSDIDVAYYIGEELSIVAGNRIAIVCTETRARPQALITWRLPNGTTLREEEELGRFSTAKLSEHSSSLIIKEVQDSDTGLYFCIAANGVGQVDAVSNLVVHNIRPSTKQCTDKLPDRLCRWVRNNLSCRGELKSKCCKMCA